MTSFLKADIFFFIATIALVIITILFSIMLLYAIKVFRTLDEASLIVKQKIKHLSHKLDDVEEIIEESTVLRWMKSLLGGKKGAPRASPHRGGQIIIQLTYFVYEKENTKFI